MLNYIRENYPETFNDYIESSEFVAIIELISYLSQSLAFRVDLNTRENFLSTAQSKDSILRLANMLGYAPKRNIPASGLMKVTSISTTEPLVDATGVSIQNTPILWNDDNNLDSFDQFVAILNSAMSSNNPFTKPIVEEKVGNIATEVYALNNRKGDNLTFNFTADTNVEVYLENLSDRFSNQIFAKIIRWDDKNKVWNHRDVKDSSEAPKADTPAEETEEESTEDQTTQFGALAKDLLKLGVFSTDEDEEELNISTPEEFLERFQEEKRKGAIEVVNNFIGQFGEDYQKAFDAIFVKGVDPKEYFGTYNNITSFSDMDLSQEQNQVAVIKQALSDQGFESEDIDSEVERLKNYGDLETVATKHHKVLVKKEAAKLQDLEQKSQYEVQQKQAIKNQYAQNVQGILQEKLKTKEFDGIPINPKLANELQDFLLVDKYKTASGETLTDFDKTILELKRPENHQTKVKVALLLKILEKDPTLSTIQKTGITKKSNELFGEVARQVTKSGTKSGSSQQKSNSWFL